MAASQLDLIMSQVQQLSASEQLQIIKRVADLLERAEQSPSIEEQLAAMAADPDIQRELRQIQTEENGEARTPESTRELARAVSLRDFTADRQWLADHRDEYAGQWVALKYGRLISHGADFRVVHAEAKAAGYPDALLELVEPSDAPPFIF
ncbi:MAG: DUF5678 domain-containing protein [Blastocatellia bacterium]